MKISLTIIIVFISQIIFSQTGTIKGKVIDEITASPLPGVNIIIKEFNLGNNTDSEGNFTFQNLKPGSYEVEFSYIGYKTKIVSEVIVIVNETTNLDITISELKNVLNETVVTKTRAKAESVKSLLTQQKNNASVSDGISAETIKKTPDRTTSDVIKRISGASIQDNKFVVIRGLNDRYNIALLNGAPLPSSEPDRKAFSFDIFPSNILDNLVITKTASPDLPGEFAGGIIQINTKSVPDKNFQLISVGSGYNTITTFKDQKTYKGGKTDFIGYDDGTRELPSSVPSTEVFNSQDSPLTSDEKVLIAKSFQNDWALNDAKFQPNTSFQYSMGRRYKFNQSDLGLVVSLSNNKTNSYNTTERNEYEGLPDPKITSILDSKFNDKNYTEQVLTAGLVNVAFKFNDNHTISFKNVYSINSSDLVVERSGQRGIEPGNTRILTSNVRWFTSNKIYSGQFNGENNFPTQKLKLTWNAFFSDIKRSIPNLRRNVYSITDPNSSNPDDTIPIASIGGSNSGGPDAGGGLFFSENKENIKGGKLDLSKKFNIGKDFINEFKIGGFIQYRDRSFFSRQFNFTQLDVSTFDTDLLQLPDSSIFSLQNFGTLANGKTGFSLSDFTKPTDKYTASSDLKAAYIMLDNRIKNFRLVWGVRLENYLQKLDAKKTDTEVLTINQTQQDFLPSANLIYSINSKQNLRLSYSKTLNRPEFRELAPFGFYDFSTQFFTQGNDSLKVAKIINIDFRYEFYPGKGQILSFSYFNKKFTNPIEVKQEINNRFITYQNAVGAKNSGIELEFRTLLSIFSKNIPFLEDMTLFSNVAIIKSVVDTSNFNSAVSDKKRPLQGQSPYIVNAGLQYLNPDNGLSISINANRAGNRIYVTESEVKAAIWEKGRTFVDMQISKTFLNKKLEGKLNIQNILAQDLIFYLNNYKNSEKYSTLETLANQVFTNDYHNENGYSAKDDDLFWKTKNGTTFSFTLTYNF